MNSPVPDRAEDAEKEDADLNKSSSFGETMNFSGDTESVPKRGLRSTPDQWVGRQLGRYEITALLGMGGMGVVLKGHDPSIERDVAIKVLPADLSADEANLSRFLAEAKSAGKLNHPNAVTIYEVGREGARAPEERDGVLEHVHGEHRHGRAPGRADRREHGRVDPVESGIG